jgi:hypothetical protein
MLVEQVFPQAIGATDLLPVQLRAEGLRRGLLAAECDALIAMLPANLAGCGCFFDRLTGI